jgi:hypothetical protein
MARLKYVDQLIVLEVVPFHDFEGGHKEARRNIFDVFRVPGGYAGPGT